MLKRRETYDFDSFDLSKLRRHLKEVLIWFVCFSAGAAQL
jgi:hypothetical protein